MMSTSTDETKAAIIRVLFNCGDEGPPEGWLDAELDAEIDRFMERFPLGSGDRATVRDRANTGSTNDDRADITCTIGTDIIPNYMLALAAADRTLASKWLAETIAGAKAEAWVEGADWAVAECVDLSPEACAAWAAEDNPYPLTRHLAEELSREYVPTLTATLVTADAAFAPVHWLRWNRAPIVGVRFGKNARRFFSERYQGTRGIPIRHHYLLGGRITIIKPYKATP